MRFQHVLATAVPGELLPSQESVPSTQEVAAAEAVRTATPQLQLATAAQTAAAQVRQQITSQPAHQTTARADQQTSVAVVELQGIASIQTFRELAEVADQELLSCAMHCQQCQHQTSQQHLIVVRQIPTMPHRLLL
jgi:hypothetical protein